MDKKTVLCYGILNFKKINNSFFITAGKGGIAMFETELDRLKTVINKGDKIFFNEKIRLLRISSGDGSKKLWDWPGFEGNGTDTVTTDFLIDMNAFEDFSYKIANWFGLSLSIGVMGPKATCTFL
jgi:hypothetical protein